MKQNYPVGSKPLVGGVVPVDKGGTNAKTVPEAQVNLGALTKNMVGIPNGAIPIDPLTGKIPPEFFSLNIAGSIEIEGPRRLNIEEIGYYKITNIDSRISYVVSADVGTVTRIGEDITYVAPMRSDPKSGFYVNGNFYSVPINDIERIPNTPKILYPASGETLNLDGITIVSSGWSTIHDVDSLDLVDWLISDTPDFETDKYYWVFTKSDVSINITGIRPGDTIYAKVRVRGIYGYYSGWSEVFTFTRSYYEPPVTPQILYPSVNGVIHDQQVTFRTSEFQGTSSVMEDALETATWEISTDGTFTTNTQVFAKSVADKPFEHTFDLVNGVSYYVRVKHKGISKWESNFSSVLNVMYVPVEPPERPTIIDPSTNSEIFSPTLTVTASDFAPTAPGDTFSEGIWQIGTDGTFAEGTYQQVKTDTLSEDKFKGSFFNLVEGKTYYVRVRYRGSSGWYSQWSLLRTILYSKITKPSIFTPLPDEDKLRTTVGFGSTPFTTNGTSGHKASEWQVSEVSDFFFTTKKEVSLTSLTTYSVSELEYGKTYFVRVRYQSNANQWSDWSDSVRFYTKAQEWDPEVFAQKSFTPTVKIQDFNFPNTPSVVASNSGDIFVAGDEVYHKTALGVELIRKFYPVDFTGNMPEAIKTGLVLSEASMVISINPEGTILSALFFAPVSSLDSSTKSVLVYQTYSVEHNVIGLLSYSVVGNPIITNSSGFTDKIFLKTAVSNEQFYASDFGYVSSNNLSTYKVNILPDLISETEDKPLPWVIFSTESETSGFKLEFEGSPAAVVLDKLNKVWTKADKSIRYEGIESGFVVYTN